MTDDSTLTADQFAEAGLPDWTWRDDAIHAHLETGDFATGLRLVNLIGEAAESMNHHPDLDLRYPHLDVKLLQPRRRRGHRPRREAGADDQRVRRGRGRGVGLTPDRGTRVPPCGTRWQTCATAGVRTHRGRGGRR